MMTAIWPAEGGCRCGRVRFSIEAPPLIEMACHCRNCQRMTASAFSTTIIVATPKFVLSGGATEIGGIHGAQGKHHHCAWCKSWIYTEAVGRPESMNVRATLLDECAWFQPWAETQTAEKLPWVHTGAKRSFERFPEMEDFEGLLRDYAAYRTPPA
jgi:hypothetical protein